jgi:hypothetical protein
MGLTLGYLAGHRQDPDRSARNPDHSIVCEELRMATWPSGRVLCGQEILTYGWDVYNTRCASETPALIVQPAEASHVEAAVKTARKYGLTISYRGSGHTYNCNAFKTGSINLDMRSMGRKVTTEVDADGIAYARLSPGAAFQDMLNPSNIPTNYSFTHGTCKSVGVMGYHIHGGWSAVTSTWANESIVAMQVVTANGTLVNLSTSSTGDEAELWRAMRVAGSSFGIVTSLTIRLFDAPFRPTAKFLVNNSFDHLLSILVPEAPFGWVGLVRWDQVFFGPGMVEGSGWIVQVTLNDDSSATREMLDRWIMESNLTVVPFRPVPFPTPVTAGTWKYGRYGFPDSGMFSRFYSYSEIYNTSRILHKFLLGNTDACRFNLGPFKGEAQLPIVSLECDRPDTIAVLKTFVDEHKGKLHPDKPGSGYVNLPLDASRRFFRAYWPHSETLSTIKQIWDPDDFFYIENGIHPPVPGYHV